MLSQDKMVSWTTGDENGHSHIFINIYLASKLKSVRKDQWEMLTYWRW